MADYQGLVSDSKIKKCTYTIYSVGLYSGRQKVHYKKSNVYRVFSGNILYSEKKTLYIAYISYFSRFS